MIGADNGRAEQPAIGIGVGGVHQPGEGRVIDHGVGVGQQGELGRHFGQALTGAIAIAGANPVAQDFAMGRRPGNDVERVVVAGIVDHDDLRRLGERRQALPDDAGAMVGHDDCGDPLPGVRCGGGGAVGGHGGNRYSPIRSRARRTRGLSGTANSATIEK